MFNNKKVLVLGLARSGYEACKMLVKLGCQVILNDSKLEKDLNQSQIKELKDLNIQCIFGYHPDNLLDQTFDYLIKNPGIRNDHQYVLLANKLNIKVINEVELAYNLLPKDIKLIAITGTNGKTTTTTLTYEILKEAGLSVHLAGNIGYPLCSFLDKVKKNDVIVMEISCQQLANVHSFKPDIALMTNLSEAHIDFLGSYENYKNVKTKLFKNQTNKDIAILNLENNDVIEQTKDILSNKKYFSSKNITKGAYYLNNYIFYQDNKIMERNLMFLKGNHNVENALSAIMIAKEFNVSDDIIKKVLMRFTGVKHRLEYIDTISNVKYYNDTEATNTKCTQIALSSFDDDIILILGGLERGQNFHDLDNYLTHVKYIIGIGECHKRVLEYGNSQNIKTYVYETLKEGFKKCVSLSNNGDIILLSPASASWDQYKECEDRGDEFRELVKKEREKNEN